MELLKWKIYSNVFHRKSFKQIDGGVLVFYNNFQLQSFGFGVIIKIFFFSFVHLSKGDVM